MVHYKLTYFDFRSRGEPSRQLFALAGVEFEDVRIPRADGEWERKLKAETPFGYLPILTVDGFEIPESVAIARYLARKFGYAGKTPEEEAWVDAIVDQFKDFFPSMRKLAMARQNKKPADEIERIRKEVFEPAKVDYFKNLNKILSNNSKSGFLVGDGVTFADLFVVDNLTTMANMGLYSASDEPKLEALHRKVTSIPALKEWIDKRPVTMK